MYQVSRLTRDKGEADTWNARLLKSLASKKQAVLNSSWPSGKKNAGRTIAKETLHLNYVTLAGQGGTID